jgi:FkbM family methyltransferase
MKWLRQQAVSTLKRLGIYYRLKASHAYDLYWAIADKRVLEARNKEVSFYRSLVPSQDKACLFFDVGANVGFKTDVFLRLGARVLAVEPDEHNQSILQEKFLKRRLFPKPVTIIGKAVSDRVGSETMWTDGPGSPVNTLNRKWADAVANRGRDTYGNRRLRFSQRTTVETTTLEELILRYGRPAFIKIDVEGFELNVIRGLRCPVPCLSFDVYLPEFRPEGLECVKLLETLSSDGKFNYTAGCQNGFALERWLDATEFLEVLQWYPKSIEVFWKIFAPRRIAASSTGDLQLDQGTL